ncbi:MAG: HEAT repeat domain-containing protein [Chloroflexi bacterium]|nr:HEAT repeat domain-containing protein [Chloroflexota bacterium]MBU1746784.1 HEAT repeat domain-containing protein [Chloroflexota bacterium]
MNANPPTPADLIAQFAHHDGAVREQARYALVQLGRLAVPQCVEVLTDPNHQVRWEAAKALIDIGDPTAAPALVAALEDEHSDIRWLAAEGLIALGPAGLVPLLQALTQRGKSVWLREGAHHVLNGISEADLPDEVVAVLAALEALEPDLHAPLAAQAALHVLS